MATAALRRSLGAPTTRLASVGSSLADAIRRILRRSLDSSHLYRALRRRWSERLTSRGRYLLVLCLLLGLAGVDTRRSLVYLLFALGAGPLLVAGVMALRRAPRVRLDGRLPDRLTAGSRVEVSAVVASEDGRASGPLVLSWAGAAPSRGGLEVEPAEAFVDCAPGRPGRVRLEVTPSRRGRFVVPGLGVAGTDPLGLFATRRRVRPPVQTVLAYPRFFHVGNLLLPAGRRYQPGGIPLASSLGDSSEFVGTRDYRDGDPVRRIHWRSWARRGSPVVKEYVEEYFSRIALVLDTFLPRRPLPRGRRRFEAAVSVLASVAGHFSRTEDVVDILAAGPEIYEVSTGRSLAYLENVLEVLACLEPCPGTPFAALAPHLDERLSRLTSVVAVLLDWDDAREGFLFRLRDMGVSVRAFVVHEGATRRPWEGVSDRIGEISQLTPAEVERLLAAEESS